MAFRTIAILGPGLLGGSLVLALERKPGVSIRVWGRRRDALEAVRARCPAVAVSTSVEETAAEADLVVLATPIGAMPGLAARVAALPRSRPAILTDVGSVKGSVVEKLDAICADTAVRFVGSHPMAGAEASGFEVARRDLFREALTIVTPGEATCAEATDAVAGFWTDLQSRVAFLHPVEHDRFVARVSHLPHAAAALVVLAALGNDPEAAAYASTGFRDTTRVALGNAEMWAGILLANRRMVLEALEDFRRETCALIELLEKEDARGLSHLLDRAKEMKEHASRVQKSR